MWWTCRRFGKRWTRDPSDGQEHGAAGHEQVYAKHQDLYRTGVPLLWSCLVGMYPEEPELGQPGIFGHVRLIIGYNEKNNTLLYSDSWGPRHALKRLPFDQAWAMTKGLIVLKPRDVR